MTLFSFRPLSAALALALLPATAAAQQVPPATVIVVDAERVFRECTACAVANAQLQSQEQQLEQRAQQLGQPIQAERQSIQQAIAALNGARPGQPLQQRIQALQTQQSSAAREIQQREQTLQLTRLHVIKQIQDQLRPAIGQVMQARGANLAVGVGSTLAHSQTLDVTPEVLARVNASLPSISVTPLPQPAQQQQQPQGR